MNPPCIPIISAPSGTGKRTVIKELLARESAFRLCVSATTRARRVEDGEIDGVDYHFINGAEFEAMEGGGEFLETEQYGAHRYGTLRKEVFGYSDRHPILEVEVNGHLKLRKILADNVPLSFFLLPPSIEVLEKRLRNRPGKMREEEIKKRMERAQQEMTLISKVNIGAHFIYNHEGRPDDAAEEILKIVRPYLSPATF